MREEGKRRKGRGRKVRRGLANHIPVPLGPRPTVPGKVCPVPGLREHQSWFPANPKVASFEVWQRWGHISV